MKWLSLSKKGVGHRKTVSLRVNGESWYPSHLWHASLGEMWAAVDMIWTSLDRSLAIDD